MLWCYGVLSLACIDHLLSLIIVTITALAKLIIIHSMLKRVTWLLDWFQIIQVDALVFWTIWIKSVETRVGQNFLYALRSSSHCHVLSVCLCHFHWLIPSFIYCFTVCQSLTLINGRSMKIAHFSDVNWSTNLVVINRLTFLSLVSSHAVSNCAIVKVSWV